MADPVDWQPRQMPTLLINQYARVMAKQVDERLRPLGVTASQLPVLVALKLSLIHISEPTRPY